MKTFFLAVLLLVSATVSAASSYVWAPNTALPTAIVAEAAKIASTLTRYPVPARLPTVYVLTAAQMAELHPSAYGLVHYHRSNVIWLNEVIPEHLRAAVLIHEIVHVMQIHAGRIPKDRDCLSHTSNELEAHAASTLFLSNIGVKAQVSLPEFSCPAAE